MKIAIISDSHDNIPNIEKFIDYVGENNIRAVIHCGDLAAPSMIIEEFGPKLEIPFHFIHGNVADEKANSLAADHFSNVICHGRQGEIEIDGKKIAFIHYPEQAKRLAETGRYDLVFYGHNHRPWEEKIGKAKVLNPGTLAGLFQKATFAVYETQTDKARLIILEKI